MPNALRKTASPQYLSLFPDWSGPRPLRFYLLEQLLEARRQSTFPTNLAGPDEDVNIYLADLMTAFLGGHHPTDVQFGAIPLLAPPAKSLGRSRQAEFYRHNADHRLIMLGLFSRGDHLRKRADLFGLSHRETHLRDQGVGRDCYQLAVNLLEYRDVGQAGIVDVWRKLAENFERYIQVLSTMAVGRLGLGAKLSQTDLGLLLTGPAPENTVVSSGDGRHMDRLLDLLLELRQFTGERGLQKKRAEVINLALHLNLDPQKLLEQTG